jgi:ubiquinone/menaquinone biosynthesis C-methylase UbiE
VQSLDAWLQNKLAGPGAGTANESNRVRWVEQALRLVPAGSRLLDAGAGEQQFKKYCGHLRYVAQDFAEYHGAGDSRGLQMGKWDVSHLDIVSDITRIPEPDASFDAILCTEVLEHVPDPLAALREFSRLLRAGVHLILTAPFCSLTHFAPYHFSTGFNRYFYETHLPACGFKIMELQPNGNYFEYLAQEIRRIPDIAHRYAQAFPKNIERLGMILIVRLLTKLSSVDRGSSELLAYGYHVRAVKS